MFHHRISAKHLALITGALVLSSAIVAIAGVPDVVAFSDNPPNGEFTAVDGGSTLDAAANVRGVDANPSSTAIGRDGVRFQSESSATDAAANGTESGTADDETEVDATEGEYVEPAPKEGDPYFEAVASDDSWISYINPRDEYRSPYLGDGSGKICVTLLNEDGEVIVGETVPNTTITVPTGDSLEWHQSADPIAVQLPLTEHYDRPLDADQFGTDSDLPQGDGYMDAHCVEFHGLPENGSIEYGEVQIDGEYADSIDTIGYIQQQHRAWDSDLDPIADARPYEEVGGGWTYQSNESHGQAVVVLQLDPREDVHSVERTEIAGDKNTQTAEMGNVSNSTVRAGGDERSIHSVDTDDLLNFGALATIMGFIFVIVVRLRPPR